MGMFGKDIPNFDQAKADELKSRGLRFGSELGLDAVNPKVPDGIWDIRFGSGIVQENEYQKDYGTEDNPNKGGVYSDAIIIGGQYWDEIKALSEIERMVKVKLTEAMALQLHAGLESTVIAKTGQSGNRYSNVYAGRNQEMSPDQLKEAYKAKLKAGGQFSDAQIQAKLDTATTDVMKAVVEA